MSLKQKLTNWMVGKLIDAMYREMNSNRSELIKETNLIWKKVDSDSHEIDKILRRISGFEEYLAVDWFMETTTNFGYVRNHNKRVESLVKEIENPVERLREPKEVEV